jgi:hypothetical protein
MIARAKSLLRLAVTAFKHLPRMIHAISVVLCRSRRHLRAEVLPAAVAGMKMPREVGAPTQIVSQTARVDRNRRKLARVTIVPVFSRLR